MTRVTIFRARLTTSVAAECAYSRTKCKRQGIYAKCLLYCPVFAFGLAVSNADANGLGTAFFSSPPRYFIEVEYDN
jgi:hypothetical protein